MTIVLVLVAIAVLAGLGVRLSTTIRSDGYARRPVPRSHHSDIVDRTYRWPF
ncbi:MAG: hypothetical protein ACRDP1_11870 [Nocardioidaceae bacterium]